MEDIVIRELTCGVEGQLVRGTAGQRLAVELTGKPEMTSPSPL
jgi:hypothetical protein